MSIARHAARLPPVEQFVDLGEGDTPLVELPRLGAAIGVPHLRAKLEGCNPTGSYKDRVSAMSISIARSKGFEGWIATSSGNAATSLAAYGSRAGMRGFLCVSPTIPREKLVPALALGATVVTVVRSTAGASQHATFEAVRAAADRHGLFLAVTAHAYNHDGMRGADTIAYELLGHAPSHVYVPTGGGGLVTAIARGFLSQSSPTAVVVAQPSGCGPIAAYLRGECSEPEVDACRSDVSGLQLPAPPDGLLAAETVTRTGGWGTSVPDEAIHAARRELAEVEGIFVEPAAAAALACAVVDRRTGRLDAETEVVLVLTATGLKDLSSVGRDHAPPVRVEELPAAVAAWIGDGSG